MKRIVLFICVLAGLSLTAGVVVAAGSARGESSPARLLLNASDSFDVVGSRVACRVPQKRANYTNRLVCFRETKPGSYKPAAGSYEVELAEGGVRVARIGDKRPLFVRSEVPPRGAAAGSARAMALFGGVARLASRQDKVFVADTNIVCRPFSQRTRAVLCVLMGSDGRVHDGTYLVWVSDRGVLVAQSRNGKAVIVFQRVHGR